MAKQFTYRMWLLETGVITRRTTSPQNALKWFQAQTEEKLSFDSLMEVATQPPPVQPYAKVGREWSDVRGVSFRDGGLIP
jgi:hypothetical protein